MNLNGNSVINVSKVIGMWGKWQIDENGKLTATEVETETLVVKKQATIGQAGQPVGITIYDRATGEPVCVFSENGALRSEAGACGAQPTTNPPSPSATESAATDSSPQTTAATADATQPSPDATAGTASSPQADSTAPQTPTEDTPSFAEATEGTQALCSDGIDNDGDGLVDLDDPDCAAFAPTSPALETTTATTTASVDTAAIP